MMSAVDSTAAGRSAAAEHGISTDARNYDPDYMKDEYLPLVVQVNLEAKANIKIGWIKADRYMGG